MTEILIDLGALGAKTFVVISIFMGVSTVLTILERRIAGWIQGRTGPNRVGPQGALQPVADLIKFVMKEVTTPKDADKFLFAAGPFLMFIPPALGWAVIPFGNAIGEHKLQIANLPIGVLFLMSVLSVGVYGIALGGWASNNKYSLLGSLRASAQLISYELSLGLGILLIVMMSGSLDPQEIVAHQVANGWNVFGGGNWLALPSGILAFTLFFIVALAENNRLPFDLAECEAELVGGFHTEYTGMNLAVFMLSEYVAMTLMCGLMTTMFLGGWDIPFLNIEEQPTIIGAVFSFASFMTKLFTMCLIYQWIRWTLPRFRYDQLMQLGWKTFLPMSLVNIAIVAVTGVFWQG